MDFKLNWKWGETSPLCVITGGAVKVGDLLWLDDDGRCRSHRDFATTQTLTEDDVLAVFGLRFLGVAMQSTPEAGKSIRVATTGTFDFPADEEAAEAAIIGDFFGPTFDEKGRLTRTLGPTAKEHSVGRIGHTYNVPSSRVYIRIKSRKTP